MKHCDECGAAAEIGVQQVDVSKTLRLPNVVVENMVVESCSSGHRAFEYPNLRHLERLLVEMVLATPVLMVGRELRFLRCAGRTRAVDFARLLGLTPQHLSRIEHEKAAISESTDRLARAVISLQLEKRGWSGIPDVLQSLARDAANSGISRYVLHAPDQSNATWTGRSELITGAHHQVVYSGAMVDINVIVHELWAALSCRKVDFAECKTGSTARSAFTVANTTSFDSNRETVH